MIVLDAEQTDRLLPYRELIEEIDRLFQEPAETLTLPKRMHLSLANEGVLLVMPACDRQIGLTKLVTVHPLNMKKGLPSVQGDVIVFDAATGRRLLLLDGPTLTAKRTAAVTAYAAEKLCPNPNGALLLVGCGVQAAAHLAAFFELFGTRQVFVHSRNKQNVAAFCKLQQHELQKRDPQTACLITPAESLKEVLPKVSMIVTATTSSLPVLPDDLPPKTFVAAVGSYRPDCRELSESLLLKGTLADSLLVVDTEAALVEAGEFVLSQLDLSQVRSLREVGNLPAIDRSLVIFKSVGHALWDLAAVRVAVQLHGADAESKCKP